MAYHFIPSRYMLFPVAIVSPIIEMEKVCFLGPGIRSGKE